MYKIVCAFAFFIFFNTGSVAQITPTPFEEVFNVISSQQVFVTSFDKFLFQLGALCKQSTRTNKEQIKLGNVECVKDVNVDSFSVSTSGDGHISFIQASFFGVDKAVMMEKKLTATFGKVSKVKSENIRNWILKPLKKGGAQRYVNFEISKEDGVVYFQIGENQGP